MIALQLRLSHTARRRWISKVGQQFRHLMIPVATPRTAKFFTPLQDLQNAALLTRLSFR